jgi:hypothetical protein
MFNLTRNLQDIWTLEQRDIYDPSSTMSKLSSVSPVQLQALDNHSTADILNETEFIVKRSKRNEACARYIITY